MTAFAEAIDETFAPFPVFSTAPLFHCTPVLFASGESPRPLRVAVGPKRQARSGKFPIGSQFPPTASVRKTAVGRRPVWIGGAAAALGCPIRLELRHFFICRRFTNERRLKNPLNFFAIPMACLLKGWDMSHFADCA